MSHSGESCWLMVVQRLLIPHMPLGCVGGLGMSAPTRTGLWTTAGCPWERGEGRFVVLIVLEGTLPLHLSRGCLMQF